MCVLGCLSLTVCKVGVLHPEAHLAPLSGVLLCPVGVPGEGEPRIGVWEIGSPIIKDSKLGYSVPEPTQPYSLGCCCAQLGCWVPGEGEPRIGSGKGDPPFIRNSCEAPGRGTDGGACLPNLLSQIPQSPPSPQPPPPASSLPSLRQWGLWFPLGVLYYFHPTLGE